MVTGALLDPDPAVPGVTARRYDLSSLVTARAIIVKSNPSVGQLSLPALTSMAIGQSFVGNDFEVSSNANLTTISAPQLPQASDDLFIESNPVLSSFNFSSLTRVVDQVRITGNTALPCAFVSQLKAQLSPPPVNFQSNCP